MLTQKLIESRFSKDVVSAFLNMPADAELPVLKRERVVRALDIGYGFTKYQKGFDKNGLPICDLFPSLPVQSKTSNLSGGFFQNRDTKSIEWSGLSWEVGPSTPEIKGPNDVRALHNNFIKTDNWRVLFYGALLYMETPVIDDLILGLPVTDMTEENIKWITKITVGEHKIGETVVTINNVKVIPQPLGGLYEYAITSGKFDIFNRSKTLIVDPGYLTYDFLVTNGFIVMDKRSGARAGGMSSIIHTIIQGLNKAQNIDFEEADDIDHALAIHKPRTDGTERKVVMYGKEFSLEPHIMNCKPVLEASMNYMLNAIGNSKDISQVVLSGGSGRLFLNSLKQQFPKHDITILDSGIFANLVGFAYWGMLDALREDSQLK